MKVHIVTNGYYSDQGIVGVFSTAEKAKAFADTFDRSEVYEWDIDKKQANDRVKCWTVYVRTDSGDEYQEPFSEWTDREKWRADSSEDYVFEGRLQASSIRSLEHARKVAAEKRQHFLRTKAVQPSQIVTPEPPPAADRQS